MSHQILSTFLKRIQRDLDAFPLERALVGKRRRGTEKLTLGIFYSCTQVLEDFVDLPKSTEPRDNTRDKKWGHMSDKHHQDSVKEHNKNPLASATLALTFSV